MAKFFTAANRPIESLLLHLCRFSCYISPSFLIKILNHKLQTSQNSLNFRQGVHCLDPMTTFSNTRCRTKTLLTGNQNSFIMIVYFF